MNLNIFFNKYGKNTTTNFELEHYAKELNISNFYCLMRNELKDLKILTPMNIIINLHTSNQRGVHWSCIFIKDKDNAYFFDSYGLDPTKEVIEFLKPIKNRMCSTFKLQNENDSYCGILSLYVLYKLNNTNFYNLIFSIKKELNKKE